MKQTKRWLLAEADEAILQHLSSELGVSEVIARMLIRRGITDPETARRFLAPDRSEFYDPLLMKDMQKAVDRIRRAVAKGERIMVYGDYDADGATSTSLMYLALQKIGANVEYYIPDRFSEGYGLNGPAIQQAKDKGFDLIVTVDNGIAAVEQVALANELGLDLIVTDHHTPPDVLPDAYAILNPKQPGCEYPDKMLAGVGIAFKVAQALFGRLPEEYLDLAVIGTVADLAPLMDENRLLTIYGLQRLNDSPRAGIKALIEVSGLAGKELTAGHIGFSFGPRINASGRLDSAAYAVELLITEDPVRAEELANFLNERNVERQELSTQIFEEALQEVEAHPEWLEGRVLVVAKEGWNAGVIGIVASRLVERYYRPTLMISITDGMGKGSARSIDGFHLYDAMNGCRDLFEHFGGHKMAAGFSIAAGKIEELRSRLNRTAEAVLSDDDMIPKINIDAEVELTELRHRFVEEVELLAPFGFGNPSPRFQVNGVSLECCRPVGADGAHLQLTVTKGAGRLNGIGFRKGIEADQVNECTRLDLAGEFTINEYNGRKSLQIVIDDWRPHAVQVFDCRQVANKQRWLEEQAAKHSLTIVCFHEEHVPDVVKSLEPYPWQESHQHSVFLADAEGNLTTVMAGQEQILTGNVVIYDLPVSLEQYQSILSQMQQQFRLYLLHGASDQEWATRYSKQLLPDRKVFAAVYKLLQDAGTATEDVIRKRLNPLYHDSLDLMLSVFVELGFAVQNGKTYHVNVGTAKRSLDESEIYKQRQSRAESYRHVIASLIEKPSELTIADVLKIVNPTYVEGEHVS